MDNSERKERRAQKKYDRSEKRYARLANRYSNKAPSEGTPITGEELFSQKSKRALKQAYKKGETVSASKGSMSKPTFTTYESRELTADELFKDRKTPRQVVRADSKGRELTADELYLDKKTPRQIVRAVKKEARIEARAAAAGARARKYSS